MRIPLTTVTRSIAIAPALIDNPQLSRGASARYPFASLPHSLWWPEFDAGGAPTTLPYVLGLLAYTECGTQRGLPAFFIYSSLYPFRA